ncbi:MAG: uncharacterized protein H6R26_312 [Proteobacteria bacterium]|nr:uncharacterized protein [Pseudomonadota bacterium]
MHDPARLIAALQNPALHGPQCKATRLLETHISWIILTGEHAYKIKKPVDFGFLDFSSLAQRRFFCHEELRLNKRLAAPLYLGVIPITGSVESPSLGGFGPVIEYAVKLRQFDEANLGDRLAQNGRLQALQTDELAATLAHFHATVPRASDADRHGLPETIEAACEQNFAHLPPPERPDDKQRISDLLAWTRTEFARLRQTLLQRKAEGHVRECHGDLHLGNLVLLDGRLTAFDCIEFSEDLRWIDIISELAFIFMDLEVRGYAGLASRLLNRYLEISGDYAGLVVMNYYRVYRAMVRAKIAGLSLSQTTDAAERSELTARMDQYVTYAEAAMQVTQPQLIITRGVSGSGKSHLAKQIAEALPAIRLCSDIERKRLAGLTADARTSATTLDGIYSREFTLRTYDQLLNTARLLLNAGFSVIVDATFLIAEYRRAQRQLADECGVRFVILDVQAPEGTLRHRIEERMRAGLDPSEADVTVLQRQLDHAEPLDETEQALAATVNSEDPGNLPALIAALANSSLPSQAAAK